MKSSLLILAFSVVCSSIFGQNNTFSHQTKNGNQVITLAEGQGRMPHTVLIDVTPEILAETMPDSIYQSATNVYLVRTTTGKNVLIDAGLGRRLLSNLQEYDITSDMIDKILITHTHFDHIGGLLDSNGAKIFSNAYLYIAKNEYAFFTDASSTVNERAREIATATVNAYRSKLVLFDSDQGVIADIIQPLPNFGHTPGHTVYVVDNDILIWGDMVHAMGVQMPYPTVSATFDIDNKKAVEARLEMLNYIVNHSLFVGGMHIPYPGMGTLTSNGKRGYIFTPIE